MTIVPLIVVALRISALRNTGIVPKTATSTIMILPKVTVLPNLKSIVNNFEKLENVLSKVLAALVIMIKLIINNKTTPNFFATSTAA